MRKKTEGKRKLCQMSVIIRDVSESERQASNATVFGYCKQKKEQKEMSMGISVLLEC